MYEQVCSEKLKLTWFGMSRLLLGNRTQFLHILLTRSSLIMTISWLQYWILTGKTCHVNDGQFYSAFCHECSHIFLKALQIKLSLVKSFTVYYNKTLVNPHIKHIHR